MLQVLQEKFKGLKLIQLLKDANMYPFFRTIEESHGSWVMHKGKRMMMLGSNNYLGLTHDPRVVEASVLAIQKWGAGCTGSRFLNGNLNIHTELERELGEFLNMESVLIFATGFMANQGAISTLVGQGDYILSDEENHASIIEGCHLSKATVLKYKHRNMQDLEEKLSQLPLDAMKMIITDGVFSMNGHVAPLKELEVLKRKYQCVLYVDDAHGIGIKGDGGRGVCQEMGVRPDILVGTFSKSLSSQGGFVATSKSFAEWIKQKARTYMFSAALSPASTASALESLKILKYHPEYTSQVQSNAEFLKKELNALGLNTFDTASAIIPVAIGNDKLALKLTTLLEEEGIFVTPVVYPAVAKSSSIIRFSVMRTHTHEELSQVVKAMKKYMPLILNQTKSDENLHDYLSQDFDDQNLNLD